MDLFHLHVHRYKKIFFGLNKNWLTLSFNQLQVEAKIPVRLSLIINEENFNLYIHWQISLMQNSTLYTLFTNNEVDPNNYLQFTLTSKCTYMASSLSCRLVSKSLTHFLDSWCQIRLMMRAVTIGCSLCSHSDFTILGLLVRAAQ